MWSPEREAEAPAGGDPAGLLPPEWEEDEEQPTFQEQKVCFLSFIRNLEIIARLCIAVITWPKANTKFSLD